jgi:hypothetical protein
VKVTFNIPLASSELLRFVFVQFPFPFPKAPGPSHAAARISMVVGEMSMLLRISLQSKMRRNTRPHEPTATQKNEFEPGQNKPEDE